jgi:5-methylcytosine-specific restriction endonuclease McrA
MPDLGRKRVLKTPAAAAVGDAERWETARERALEHLRQEFGLPLDADDRGQVLEFMRRVHEYRAKQDLIMSVLTLPHCFRCGETFMLDGPVSPRYQWDNSAGYLERAHLVDRSRGGLDGPQNLMPLCHRCHKAMPSFDPGEGPDAIAWIRRDDRHQLPIVHNGDVRKFAHLVAEAQIRRQLVGD